MEQHVLHAFYFKDLNQTEIARQMGISCNYVSHILRNATKKLKNILHADELRTSQLQLTHMRQRLEMQQAQLDQMPIVDDLTRLYNRRYYDNRLQEEVSRASRTGTELSVIFVRLDGLETLSRQLGTLKRDEALTGTSDILRRSVRRVDILTRYDEQTFALILPFTGESVDVVTRRMEQNMAAWLREKGWNLTRQRLTFGIGSAVFPLDSRQPETLSRLACAESKSERDALPLLKAA